MAEATNGADVKPVNVTMGYAARNAAMEQIAKNAHANVASEMQDFNEETGEIAAARQDQGAASAAPAVQTQDVEDDDDDQGGTPAVTAAPVPVAPAEEDTETLIVDGKEMAVPKSKLIDAGRRAMQKESAADRRLQEATEMLRQAQQFAAQVGMTGLPNQGAHQQAPQQQSAPSGEDEQGQQQPQQRQNAQVDPQAISAQINNSVSDALYRRDAESAARRFKEEFPDIVGNPMSMTWVAQQEDQRIRQATANGQPLGDPYEAYRTHGEAARQQLKALGVPAKAATTAEAKADRKRDTVVVTGASIRTPAPQADKPKSTSQIIEDMRKARHQRTV